MKILIATSIYPPEIGRPADYIKKLCTKLKNDHKISVVAFTDIKKPIIDTELFPVSKKYPLLKRLIYYFIYVWKASKEVDVIYVQNAMSAGLPVSIVSFFRSTPFIINFLGDESWERSVQLGLTKKSLDEFLEKPEGNLKTRLMFKIQGYVMKQASLIITPSLFLKDQITKAYKIPQEKVVVNNNPAEDPEIIPFKIKREPFKISSIGKLSKKEDVESIINVFIHLKNKYQDLKLVIANDNLNLNDFENLNMKPEIKKDITFLRKISKVETWQLLRSSVLSIINSSYETSPNYILKSFAAETPIVAFKTPGTREFIVNGLSGLLMEKENIKDVSDAVESILKSSDLQLKLSSGGLMILKQNFSWENHLKNLYELFKSVELIPSKKF